MPNSNVVDFQTVIRAMLPKGDIYVPKEFLFEVTPGQELIVNGDFASNLDDWTDLDTNGLVDWGGVSTWDAGELSLGFSAA